MDTPLEFPGNNQHHTKCNKKFSAKGRDYFHDWYNVVFRSDFTFKALANGASVGANMGSAPIKASFSLIKSMAVKSASKTVIEADKIHKIIFIKKLAGLL